MATTLELMLPQREESSALRERALLLLQALVDAWVPRRGATLLHFGSYRLDVHDASSDIDTVAVVPHSVPRSTLFSAFVPLLRAHDEVTDVRALRDAFVPVVKFTLAGVSIDFLCAQCGRSWSTSTPAAAIDAAWLRSSSCLAGMDIDSVRSLNGSRVAARIIALVPKLAPFRLALRAVRCWAKARGLYSNVLGYLGGINWALLVARVCQDYPDAAAPELTRRFFAIYAEWNWATTAVHLCGVERASSRKLKHLKVWGVIKSDSSRAMSLVTPSFPAMNSSFNVTSSTLAIIAWEFRRAAALLRRRGRGSAVVGGRGGGGSLAARSQSPSPGLPTPEPSVLGACTIEIGPVNKYGMVQGDRAVIVGSNMTQWKVETVRTARRPEQRSLRVQKSHVNVFWAVVPSPLGGVEGDRSSSEQGADEGIVEEEGEGMTEMEGGGGAATLAAEESAAAKKWAALFAPSDFFDRYCDFVEVRIVAAPSASGDSAWLGWCESRLRFLVAELCAVSSLSAGTVHLLAHAFTPPSETFRVDADADADADAETRRATHFYIGIAPSRAPLEIESAEEARRASRDVRLGTPVDLSGAWSAFAAQLGAQRPDDGTELILSHLTREELPEYCCASALDPLARGDGEGAGAAAATAAKSPMAVKPVTGKRKRVEQCEQDCVIPHDAAVAMDVESLLASIGAPPPGVAVGGGVDAAVPVPLPSAAAVVDAVAAPPAALPAAPPTATPAAPPAGLSK